MSGALGWRRFRDSGGCASLADVSSAAGAPLQLTAHPLQRCGARAVVVLAGRSTPASVTIPDLDAVAYRLTVEELERGSVIPGVLECHFKRPIGLCPSSCLSQGVPRIVDTW
jgi:hypothetical protein